METRIVKRDLLSVADFSTAEIKELINLATEMKKGMPSRVLDGKAIALLFEKPSLRTRVSFEMAIHQLRQWYRCPHLFTKISGTDGRVRQRPHHKRSFRP